MKVLLINPCIRPNSPKKLLNVGMAYIATAIDNAGFDLEIVDVDAHRYSNEQLESILRTKKFDIVGIGDLTSHFKWVKGISALLKSYHPHAPIMVGNTLGTSIPNLLLKKSDVDIAVISEGEATVIDLLSRLQNHEPLEGCQGIAFKKEGKIITTPSRKIIPEVDSIPFPNYDLFEMDIYLECSKWTIPSPEMLGIAFDDIRAMPLVTARGCPFKCTFCFHAFQNKKYRWRSAENIVAEMKLWQQKYGANFFNFWDELSFYHHDQVRKFTRLLLEQNVNTHFVGSCRSELIDEENADIAISLKKAGCMGLSFSLESGNPEILKAMNKKNTVTDFITQAKILQEAGVATYTAIVLGYPQESKATIRETFSVLEKAKIYPSVGYLQPMPGTPMYTYAHENGYIPDEETYLESMGDRQDLRINLSKHITAEEMEQVVIEECRKLNKVLNINLNENELIKTRVYRKAKSEAFLHSFGIAAKILEEDTSEVENKATANQC